MAKQTLDFLVAGGKATAGPPIGSTLGPLGVNIQAIVTEINKKTADMAGINVPIKLSIDTETKAFEIEVGIPPVSALIMKELKLEKGSGKTGSEFIADMPIDLVIKLSRVKSNIAPTPKAAVKQVIGTCQAVGVLVEGQNPKDAMKRVEAGEFDDKISGKVKLKEISMAEIEEKKKELQAVLAAKKAAEEKAAAEAAALAAAAKPEGEEAAPVEEAAPTDEKKATIPEVKKAAAPEAKKPTK